MIGFICFLWLFCSSNFASTNFDTWLAKPIEERVTRFREAGTKAYPFLSAMAFNPHATLQMRWRAITTMGRLDSAHFRADLERSLKDQEWFLRNAGLIALLNDDRKHAIQWSIRLLTDPALVVRTQAVRNLIALNASEAEPELWKGIFDRHNFKGKRSLWVRAHMAEALAKFAAPGRAKAFQKLLLDQDERLHKWAIIGLETSTGVQLSDRSEPVQIRRQKWLARLGVEEI